MGYSRKNPQPHNGRHGGKSYGGGGGVGVNSSGNPDGRGVLNLKLHPTSKFSETALHF